MKTRLFLIVAITIGSVFLTGCNSGGQKEFLSVNFTKGQTLSYEFVTSRDFEIDWGPTRKDPNSKHKIDKSFESVTMVVDYTPVEVDPYGLSTIEANIKSVKIDRFSRTGQKVSKKDAVENFRNKSFKFTVDAVGKFDDRSSLDALIKEVGETAFRAKQKRGRVKEQDMIDDFIVTQWFLWDAVSSIENVANGVALDQKWNSQLSIPTPMVMRKARNVEYTMAEIRQQDDSRIAVIKSDYTPAEKYPTGWPIPYSGSFQMAGMYGFLRGYKLLELDGEGEELFDITAGKTLNSSQDYNLKVEASFPLAISQNPVITINQKISMKLLPAEK